MEVVKATDQKKEAFLDALDRSFAQPIAEERGDVLSKAREVLRTAPVPTTRTEAWKYTRTSRIVNTTWNATEGTTDVAKHAVEGLDAWRLVFVNGRLQESLSSWPSAEGLTVKPLRDALAAGEADGFGTRSNTPDEWFECLNMAYATDGLYIHLAKNQIIEQPIYLLHITTGEDVAAFNRNYVALEQGAQLNIIQHSVAEEDAHGFYSVMTEGDVAPNANLHIDKVQNEAGKVYQHAVEWIHQERDSMFDIRTVTLRGHWVRNNLNIAVNGENCSTKLYGTYMPVEKEHLDNHTMVDHRVPHCESDEVYKGIVTDKATGVFNGKVFVRQDAQKTNAFQQNANIILTDDAQMYSKPELEIYADDVKCSHGSTTGQFDEEAVFYLRARGLSEESARELLVYAFVSEIIDAINNEHLREYCLEGLRKRSRG
jgi:Fe-S cluster assembly protein SufD